jgi:hypothetical protein
LRLRCVNHERFSDRDLSADSGDLQIYTNIPGVSDCDLRRLQNAGGKTLLGNRHRIRAGLQLGRQEAAVIVRGPSSRRVRVEVFDLDVCAADGGAVCVQDKDLQITRGALRLRRDSRREQEHKDETRNNGCDPGEAAKSRGSHIFLL